VQSCYQNIQPRNGDKLHFDYIVSYNRGQSGWGNTSTNTATDNDDYI